MENKKFVRPLIITCVILAIPAAMMLLGVEGWLWGPVDFIAMGILIFGAGFIYELLAGRMDKKSNRVILAVATVLAVIVVWMELAVGAISQLVQLIIG